MENGGKNNMVKRVLDVLEYVTRNGKATSILTISENLGIPASTVHRILQAMVEEGYVEQQSDKLYSSTYKLLSMVGEVPRNDPLVKKLYPFMCYYAATKQCQVGLSVFYQDELIVHIASVGSAGLYNDLFALPGSTLPAYCTAAGKVFLSQLNEEELLEWIRSHNIVPMTQHTIIDPQELIDNVSKMRELGYGIVISELYEEIACVSIPIVNREMIVVGALNFSTNPDRFHELYNDDFIESVKAKLKKIEF